jgi:hypothetical protein
MFQVRTLVVVPNFATSVSQFQILVSFTAMAAATFVHASQS